MIRSYSLDREMYKPYEDEEGKVRRYKKVTLLLLLILVVLFYSILGFSGTMPWNFKGVYKAVSSDAPYTYIEFDKGYVYLDGKKYTTEKKIEGKSNSVIDNKRICVNINPKKESYGGRDYEATQFGIFGIQFKDYTTVEELPFGGSKCPTYLYYITFERIGE